MGRFGWKALRVWRDQSCNATSVQMMIVMNICIIVPPKVAWCADKMLVHFAVFPTKVGQRSLYLCSHIRNCCVLGSKKHCANHIVQSSPFEAKVVHLECCCAHRIPEWLGRPLLNNIRYNAKLLEKLILSLFRMCSKVM